MSAFNVRRTEADLRRSDLALRIMTALLRAAAVALVLIAAEAWCGGISDPDAVTSLTASPPED